MNDTTCLKFDVHRSGSFFEVYNSNYDYRRLERSLLHIETTNSNSKSQQFLFMFFFTYLYNYKRMFINTPMFYMRIRTRALTVAAAVGTDHATECDCLHEFAQESKWQ